MGGVGRRRAAGVSPRTEGTPSPQDGGFRGNGGFGGAHPTRFPPPPGQRLLGAAEEQGSPGRRVTPGKGHLLLAWKEAAVLAVEGGGTAAQYPSAGTGTETPALPGKGGPGRRAPPGASSEP